MSKRLVSDAFNEPPVEQLRRTAPVLPVKADIPGEMIPGFEALPRAGINRIEDAMITVPYGYVDGTQVHSSIHRALEKIATGQRYVYGNFKITDLQAYDENRALIRGFKFSKKTAYVSVLCIDDNQQAFEIRTFGQGWAWKEHQVGEHYDLVITGAKQFGRDLSVEATPVSGRLQEVLKEGRVAPLYAGTQGAVKGERVTATIDFSVNYGMTNRAHWLAARDFILDEAKTDEKSLLEVSNTSAPNLLVILRALHRPTSYEEGMLAREAVKQIAAAAVRARSQYFFAARAPHSQAAIPGIRNTVAKVIRDFTERTKIQLTKGQLNVINEIATAWEQGLPSAHLINGDVGTGKTLTFLIPAVAAFKHGVNVAVMAPTGILADQIALEIVNKFPDTGVHLLEAGKKMPPARGILVGTPGLATICNKAKWVPGVLITDEEHKMAAEVRERLVGPHTHYISATATPIPRTMAIAMYAGLKQLILSENPVKKNILTRAIYGEEGRQEFTNIIRQTLTEGKKVAFVYTAVRPKPPKEKDDKAVDATTTAALTPEELEKQEKQVLKLDRANVLERYEALNSKFPGKVACLYGDMDETEQRREIAAMRSGEKKILVASTLVEVGIDIPELDAMVCVDAENLGLSQLHQLRGRLVRRGGTGNFMMFVRKPVEDCDAKTVDRLQAMVEIADGFKLAEVDMVQRGFGDTGGDQQSGKIYTIFKGIAISPRDFLKLSIKDRDFNPPALAPLPEPVEAELPVIEEVGQMSLI